MTSSFLMSLLCVLGSSAPSADWIWRLAGRLHPMMVHFPIALLLLAAFLAAIRILRRRGLPPGPAESACTVIGAVSAAAAAVLGWANADYQDYAGKTADLLAVHRNLGLGVAGLSLAAAILLPAVRRGIGGARLLRVHAALLFAAAAAVSGGGHFGGMLVYGDDYLTSAIPEHLRFWEPRISASSAPPAPSAGPGGSAVDFVKDIKPVFDASCISCHGPKKQQGELRLDAKHLAIRGGKSGRAILAGDGAASTVVRRMKGLDSEKRMPQNADPLPADVIARIEAWINQGAVWPDAASVAGAEIKIHWAYVPPRAEVRSPKSEVQSQPVTSNSEIAGDGVNLVDEIVHARLTREKLAPGPAAPRETLIRRLSLDLVGLPPTPEEVDAFVNDPAPDAYEKLVDRLLASPHFGERWARPWLDLARYSDTNGFQGDRRRQVWAWRDWVINALNTDMPYDRFTIEQIAGDMLPDATEQTRIASGFHRNTMLNQEGGVDKEEARWETLVDRVGTTGTVWLGSTVMCCQCHDHKYDPFTQKDFYAFLAFFESADEPVLKLPTPEQAKQAKRIEAEMDKVRADMDALADDVAAAQPAWEKEMRDALAAWTPLDPVELRSGGGATLTKADDRSVLASGPNPEKDVYTIVADVPLEKITGLRLEVLTHDGLPQGGPGRYNSGQFVLTGIEAETAPLDGKSPPQPVRFGKALADYSQQHYEVSNLIDGSPDGLGWAIDAWKKGMHLERQAILLVDGATGFPGGTRLTIRLRQESKYLGNNLGRFRLSTTAAGAPERSLDVPIPLVPVLAAAPESRKKSPARDLAERYQAVAPLLKPHRERLASLRKELEELGIPSTLVMQEPPSAERPWTHLRIRGGYVNRGEKIYAATPSFLHPFPADQMPNRLGLAHWLVAPDNPLVGRVTVNRFWEQLFGRGLVVTSEDFGLQGTAPSHPKLLDRLAGEFTGNLKWSVKGLLRLIVTSATYRRSSRVTPELLARDPYNVLLARGPRFRVEGEMIRDIALSVSGLLSPTIGGPPVFPPQPEGTLPYIPFNTEVWRENEGADRYRRGLYTFWRRTNPYPTFMTFDAPSREVCTVRRTRTNTPLQALAVMNDPVFVECAQAFGRRLATLPEADLAARIAYGLRLCIGRKPAPEEIAPLADLLAKQRARYGADPEAAKKLVAGPVKMPENADPAELAAWTVVANALLNLDETLTKE